MKKNYAFLFLLFILARSFYSQVPTPTLYFTITSHNEMTSTPPNAEPYDSAPSYTFFFQTRDTLRKIVDLIYAKNAKYDLQTCQKFVLGSIHAEAAATSTTDILEYAYKIGGPPYGSVVQIDPRYKTQTGVPSYTYNMADVAHLIDSTGAVSSNVVGGFVYYNSTVTPVASYTSGDWAPFTTTINGTFNNSWKADILWGAGSIPPHTHDASNFGVWKPRDLTDSVGFFCHNPAQNVWIQGNGCSWDLSATANVQTIISEIRQVATKISNGTYPANKFYNATMMINFKDFQSPGFRVKLTEILDSLNYMKTQGKIVWATINQKHAAFQSWSAANSIAYSQWRCGQTATIAPTCAPTGFNEYSFIKDEFLSMMPNPASNQLTVSWGGQINDKTRLLIFDNLGRKVHEEKMNLSILQVNTQNYNSGIYTVIVYNDAGQSKPQKLIISK